MPPTQDVQSLQRAVVVAFQNLINQLNAPATDTVDVGNQRIANVAWPSLEADAVPLGYLKKFKPKQEITSTAGGKRAFGIIALSTGAAGAGDTIPAYPAGSLRQGTPNEVLIYAGTPASSSPLVLDWTIDGTSLTGGTGFSLGTSTTGPVSFTSFTASPRLGHLSLAQAQVLNADGVAGDITFVLVIKQ